MGNKVGRAKVVFFALIGAIAGLAVAILLRPSYPVDAPHYLREIPKPSLFIIIQGALSGRADATERTALIYLIVGTVLGLVVGVILARVTSRQKA